MPKYTPSSLEYKPRSFDEMLKPIAMYKEQYDTYQNHSDQMMDLIAELEANVDPNDKHAIAAFNESKKAYNDAIESINNYGLSKHDAQNFMNARKVYREQFLPYAAAYQLRNNIMKAQGANAENPDYKWMKGQNPYNYMLSDYLHGNVPQMNGISGSDLMKYSGTVGASLFISNDFKTNNSNSKYVYDENGNPVMKVSKGNIVHQTGIPNADAKLARFRRLINVGTEESLTEAMKADGGIWWNHFMNLKKQYNIDLEHYSAEDVNFLDNKIIDGLDAIAHGYKENTSSYSEELVGGSRSGNGNGGGNPYEYESDGWINDRGLFTFQSPGTLDRMVRIRGNNGENTWGVYITKKVRPAKEDDLYEHDENGKIKMSNAGFYPTPIYKPNATTDGFLIEKEGVTMDKFLTIKNGKVVLKSDDEIRRYLMDRNKNGYVDENDYKNWKKAVGEEAKGSRYDDGATKYKVKVFQVDKMLEQIKSAYNDINDVAGDFVTDINSFMDVGKMALYNDGVYSSEKTRWMGRRRTNMGSLNLSKNDVLMYDGQDYGKEKGINTRTMYFNPLTGDVEISYLDGDSNLHTGKVNKTKVQSAFGGRNYDKNINLYKKLVNAMNSLKRDEDGNVIEVENYIRLRDEAVKIIQDIESTLSVYFNGEVTTKVKESQI